MNLPRIKYVLIVFETKRILCEYEEDEIKNIKKTIRNILDNRVKNNETSSLTYDEDFTIFYKNDCLVTVLCATDVNYPDSTAYDFLNDLINTFRKQYKEEEIREAYSYSFNNEFKKQIKTKVSYYNKNLDSKDLTNLDRLKDSLIESKNNLVETVQILHLRETELSHNVEKAEDLKDKTSELLINARKAKKAESNNKPYKKIIQFALMIFVVYCILTIMCGGMRLPNCSI
jgi:hypothetical protein